MKKINMKTSCIGCLITIFSMVQVAHAQWSLTGNAGTNATTNFIGTTDNKAFKIRTNNSVRITVLSTGKVGIGTASPIFKLDVKNGSINTDSLYRINGNTIVANPGTGNLAVGVGALGLNSNRFNLVAVGDSTLYNNSVGAQSSFEGNYNTAVGSKALKNNTTGAWNTAFGYRTLYKNTFGTENTAVGSEALENSVFGTGNTALGHQTLQNTTGYYNTAVGKDALNSNTTGSDNIAIGKEALLNNTDRSGNVAIGTGALYDNGIGTANSYEAVDNVAVGFEALNANTTGFDNTAMGQIALHSNNTGFHNTAIGSYSINQNTSGFYNTAIGDNTMTSNTTGSQNTALGHATMPVNTTGSYNTCVGAYATISDGISNASSFGNGATATLSNTIAVGNTSIGSIKGQVGFTTFSDARIKKNIQENVPGLKFINELKPVTYNYDIHKQNELLGVKDNGDWAGKYDIEQVFFSGFLAQDVEAAAKKSGYDFSGIDKSGNLLGLRYAEFTVPLVKAVQELSKQNDDQQNQNEYLMEQMVAKEKAISNLQNQLSEMKQCVQSLCDNSSLKNSSSYVSAEGTKLFQNQPNPFNHTTVIRYILSAQHNSGVIIIRDLNGNLVKSIAISNTDKGQVRVNANEFTQGTYTYTLEIAGESVDTKLMVITK